MIKELEKKSVRSFKLSFLASLSIGVVAVIANVIGPKDALQFLTANLYEMSLFKAAQRKITIDRLIEKYNEIVLHHESDKSLLIRVD